MKPYINSYTPPGEDYAFTPENFRNAKSDGYADIVETGVVPGLESNYTVELANRILRNGTLQIKSNGQTLTQIPYHYVVGPDEVGVSFDLPLIKLNSSRVGQALEVTYTPMGSVISSAMINAIQQAVVKVLAVTGAIDLNSLAKLNAANEFTAKQTITTDTEFEPNLKLSAVQQPGIEAEDRVFSAIATFLFSGDLGAWLSSHGIEAPYFTGNHFGYGGGLYNLDASNITAGTLALARLHGNVARREQANTFTQNQTFNGGLTCKVVRPDPAASSTYSILTSDVCIVLRSHASVGMTITLPPLGSVDDGKVYYVWNMNTIVTQHKIKAAAGQDIGVPWAYANEVLLPTQSGRGLMLVANKGWNVWEAIQCGALGL